LDMWTFDSLPDNFMEHFSSYLRDLGCDLQKTKNEIRAIVEVRLR